MSWGDGGPPSGAPTVSDAVGAGGGGEAFVTYAQGRLKVFNATKNFGFISPVFRAEGSEGPPLKLSAEDGLWFFGKHGLPLKTQPGVLVSFEVWENSEGKPQARWVELASEQSSGIVCASEPGTASDSHRGPQRRHPHEPRVIYPSVYISDVPVEYTEETLKKLHKKLGLEPDGIMGIKFLPFTEASLGQARHGGAGEDALRPLTGSVILRYANEEAANGAVQRLAGHPVLCTGGTTRYLGVRHAAPAKWMMERRQAMLDDASGAPAPGPPGEPEMAKPNGGGGNGSASRGRSQPSRSSSRGASGGVPLGTPPLPPPPLPPAMGMPAPCIGGWGAAIGAPDPYYKTQPCPYHRQGVCPMGQGCYFAHAPEELRATPETMMAEHLARLMGQKPKKDKHKKEKDKEKKEKKTKKEDGEKLESSDSCRAQKGLSRRRGGYGHSGSERECDCGTDGDEGVVEGSARSARRCHRSGAGRQSMGTRSPSRKKQRIELADADF